MKLTIIMNENMYLCGRGKVSDVLYRLLHELIGFVQATILTVLVCTVNCFLL